jgi:inner membrane protein
MLLAFVCFSALFFLKRKNSTIAFVIFFGNIFAHLILDTIVGKIEWLYPFSNIAISLFEVPNVYGFWIYNFIFHWTFLLEIAVLFCAGFVLLRKNPFRK